MNVARKLKREDLRFFLKVNDPESGVNLGRLANLTETGMMLISKRAFAPHTSMHFSIDLPDTILGKNAISLHAECRWCETDINPKYFAVGFLFQNISPVVKDVLVVLLEEYLFIDKSFVLDE